MKWSFATETSYSGRLLLLLLNRGRTSLKRACVFAVMAIAMLVSLQTPAEANGISAIEQLTAVM